MTAATLPRRFGRYALFDFVGKGGMAEIYLARAETELGASRLCVVKEILPELADVASFADMLVYEAKLAARLDHANIVQVFDLGRTEGRLYIAMEYVEGYDLNALLRELTRRKVRLPLEHALHIVSEVLRGLSFAHRAKGDDGAPLSIVHRDVSPSNILISLDGEVKLCDFGIAKANEGLGSRSGEVGEALRGKAGYMSPEHARGEALDARADLFAVGIVLWELLSGRRMYRAQDGESLLEVARRAAIPELAAALELPQRAELEALLARALAESRTERFESASQMSRALDDYLVAAEVAPNPLAFGRWLRERVGSASLDERRERERLLTPHAQLDVAFSALDEQNVPSPVALATQPRADAGPAVAASPAAEPTEAAVAAEASAEAPPPAAPASEVEAHAPERIDVEVPPVRLPTPSFGAMRSFVRELHEDAVDDDELPETVVGERAVVRRGAESRGRSALWLGLTAVLALALAVAYFAAQR